MSHTTAWTDPDFQLPQDEQFVLARWRGEPWTEPLRYFAADAPDGPERWEDCVGDKMDRPTWWMPIPEEPK